MTVSREVQMAVDEIRRERDALAAAKKANELQAQQLADLRSQVSALSTDRPLSDEDKQALLDAINDAHQTNSALADAVPENTEGSPAQSSGGQTGGFVAAEPPEHNPDAPRPDPIAGTGKNGSVPLMPNMAFDPSAGSRPAGASGQPEQAPVIETAGGFVISGGGTTARAPGSRPESPSSSTIVPEDPNAKGPASTADEVKSGLGDSSQNALKGQDGRPIEEQAGIPREASPAQQKAAQEQQDRLDEERARREANPLNLSDEDLAKRQQADKGKGTADDPGAGGADAAAAKEDAARRQAQERAAQLA
jgi:hypothetical protein